MAQETVYRVVSPSKFTSFLKKFASIEPTLLVEVGDGEIKAKTHTSDRAVVKFSKMGLNEAFDFLDGADEPIIFGLFNIEKFAGSFKHFGNDQFDMIIEHDTADGKNIGTRIVLKNNKVTIKWDCASYRLFTHITDDLFLTGIAGVNGDLQSEFDLDKNAFSSISSICGIDADHKLLTFKAENNTIIAKGKAFDMNVLESSETLSPAEISFYKSHFTYVDKEDTNVKIAAEKVVFSSSESDTITVIGKTDDE